jgi:CubicO group peptidase (beta-lactamase class C family)
MTPAEDPLAGAVERFREVVEVRQLALDGLHIWRRDGAELAWRWTPDERRDVYSASKTFTSVAIGLAEHEGLLSLDDPVLGHLPQFAGEAADGVAAMTLRHLLTMTAGSTYRWLDPDADHPGDPARDFLATPLAAEPGTAYHYRGVNSYVLGRVIHAVSGQDLCEFLIPRLFAPLGIANPQWHRCPLGYPLGAIGLFLRTSELARLGRALLEDGSFEGRQIVPADYVARMRETAVDTGRAEPDNRTYALHAWQCSRDGAWRMDGIYGQFSIMLPRHAACITVMAHYEGPTTDILDAIWAELVPHVVTGSR